MTTWPGGYGRVAMDEVDSTLDEGRRQAALLAAPTWIFANLQTAARGRRGRKWSQAPGNFSATLVLPLSEEPQHAALRSFVSALALFQALEAVLGENDGLALKWPNDVLLNGGKIAGILLETVNAGGALSHLLIGIGVNLAHAPASENLEEGALRAVSVAGESGVSITPEDFLDHLARCYAICETQFATYGFEPIRRGWLNHAAKLGDVITARTTQDSLRGTFEDVDMQGQLVLGTAKGRVAIPAADVFF